MAAAIDLRILALLAARLCHELIGPVAAIANGAELLAEEDAGFVRDAARLVGDSAAKAGAQLQFYRFAYGFTGGGLTGATPDRLVAGFFAGTAVECEYRPELAGSEMPRQQLACAMLAVAAEGLPRGGRLVASAGLAGIAVAAEGPGAGLSPELRRALSLAAPAALTPRTVGGYHAGLLAEPLGLHLKVSELAGGFRLGAGPAE
jgi:histidine phosphotransferase ChpT